MYLQRFPRRQDMIDTVYLLIDSLIPAFRLLHGDSHRFYIQSYSQ
jgi:hypothetical protein